jgi:hypothetical protein
MEAECVIVPEINEQIAFKLKIHIILAYTVKPR